MSDMTLEEVKNKVLERLQNRYLLVLLAIVGFSAFIRFKYAFFDGMWVDESGYARLAKELPKHIFEYSLPKMRGELTKTPPVYNYLITISNMILGGFLGTDTAIRIVSPIMGTFSVISSYFLGREILNKRTGLLAASLVSVNGILWFISRRILVGATLTFFFTTTLLAFYYGLKDKKYSKYAIWAWGPLIVLTALSKQPGYVLGPVILTFFLYMKRGEIKDYFMTDKDFKDSKLWGELTNRNYYIALGLFGLLMLPWIVRNMGVCGFPLCSAQTALEIVEKTEGIIDVRGTFFFLTGLPGVLTLPIAAVTGFKILKNFFDSFNRNADLFVKKTVLSIVLVAGAFFMYRDLTPLMMVGSLAMYAIRDGEKLLWIATAFGLGVMSINDTKVPRYIVFVIPALLTITAIGIEEFSSIISSLLDNKISKTEIRVEYIAVLIIIPLLWVSFVNGQNMVSSNGFQALEPAGEWLAENTNEEDRFIATSPQHQYYAYPRMYEAKAGGLGDNETEFRNLIIDRNISYILVDVYERTQPEWMNTDIPPYRMTRSLANQIRSGQLSGQEAFNQFKQQPDYLVPIQSFGQTNMPLTEQNQPEVIIYQVNRSALQ